jgi:hypothetical protein
MPGVFEYIPPTDAARDDFSGVLNTERTARRNAYRTAIKYYTGDQPDQLDIQDDGTDDNTPFNLVKVTADRTGAFLFPDIPKISLGKTHVEDTPSETWVKNLINANGGLHWLVKWSLRGFLAGHTFHQVTPGKPFPRISLLDPLSVTVYWRVDDVADVVWYEVRFLSGNTPYVRDFVKKSDGNWVIYTYKGSDRQVNGILGKATRHGEVNTDANLDSLSFKGGHFTLADTVPHVGSYPPIIETAHLPHPDDRYGLSEFNQQKLQDAINFSVSNLQRLTRENADPVDFISGVEAEDIDDEGKTYSTPNASARITRLELKGDMANIGANTDRLVKMYLAVCRVVVLQGEAKDLQRVTNASVRTLFLDMLSKNAILMSSYGSSLAQMVKLALEMGFAAGEKVEDPKDLEPVIKFPTPLPTDLTEMSNIAIIGVDGKFQSRKGAAAMMGWNWEEIRQDLKDEEDLEPKPVEPGAVPGKPKPKPLDK